MKKFFYVCSTLEQTGPTSQLFNIISGLDRTLYKPIVVTLSAEKNNSLKDKFDAVNIPVMCLDESGMLGINELEKRLLNHIEQEQISVVHTQGIRADLIMSKLVGKLSINWISTLRNIPYLDYPAQYGKVKGLLMAVIHLLALRKCKKVVVVSESVRKPLQKFFKRDINVINNGIDTLFYNKDKIELEAVSEVRQQYKLAEDLQILIYTGVFEERKNLLPLLDEINKVDGFKLLLVGKGSQLAQIQLHPAVINEKVAVVGAVSDVRPYIIASDAFILVSKAEGLPNSVLEALALGCPAILSDIGPHKEIHVAARKYTQLIELADMRSLSSFLTHTYPQWRNKIEQEDCAVIAARGFSSSVNSLSYQKLYLKGEL
ncbi:glycosyltransferase family 4 protein [Aliivibrio sp. EL58]|uniref:glycosyltransferase family 4 protein n=1 Tax=Aliivibrio sp. EL58 TaxID=2107582 RepID=UPI000EFC9322|nr:glycosyltransferase family 4 protein [Aliivibrio sp. EL58]